VQFGISPFGIWRPKDPPQIIGMDAYDKTYADARKWLAGGWVDFLAPQLYWPIAPPEHSFPVLLNWWHAQNVQHRHVWPALADSNVGGKFEVAEIPSQIQIIRQKEDPGAVHYHLRSVLENPALAAAVTAQYSLPALVPPTPWIIATALPPAKLSVSVDGRSAHVEWPSSPARSSGWWVLQTRAAGSWTTRILPAPRADYLVDANNLDAVALRAADRLGNLSPPLIWTPKKYGPPPPARGAKPGTL
jgi:hypothetical protein